MKISTKDVMKRFLIATLLLLITIMHFSASGEARTLHVLHRELYFIPILLTAFWYGFYPGLVISLLSGFLYASYILTFPQQHTGMATAIPQALIFVLVGTMLGWLAEKRKQHHKKEMIDSNIILLGKASSAVAHEMKNILHAMKTMYMQGKGLDAKEFNNDFEAELDRLNRMVDILSSYAKQEKGRVFSNDLNKIIKEKVAHYRKEAIESGIIFESNLDPAGCPSWIDPHQIGWILDKLIENAMEVSTSGDTIRITSQRGGEFCSVSVKDQGPGIRPEHLDKIFSPFFTTKPDGQGLALAGCRKTLHDLGGDISVQSTLKEGTEFTIRVPREHKGKPLAEDMAKAVFQGHSDEQLYRE